MKILVLMPLNERMVYAATGIYRYLPDDKKDITFSMPMFMEYAVDTKICEDWLHALFLASITAREFYKNNEDCIIIGNLPINMKFDMIFNFQDIEVDLPYQDLGIMKFIEVINQSDADEDSKNFLLKYLVDLYSADASTMPLHNCHATAEFLSNMMDSDPHLEKFEEEKLQSLAELYKLFGRKKVDSEWNGGFNNGYSA